MRMGVLIPLAGAASICAYVSLGLETHMRGLFTRYTFDKDSRYRTLLLSLPVGFERS